MWPKLTAAEFSFIPEAFWGLFMTRLKVLFFRSAKYLPSISQNITIPLTKEKFETGKKIAVVINGLSSRTPWLSSCLVKVLATHKMLKKRKIPHTVHFGVKKTLSNSLNAHAWLSVAEEIIIGGENSNDFQEISKF